LSENGASAVWLPTGRAIQHRKTRGARPFGWQKQRRGCAPATTGRGVRADGRTSPAEPLCGRRGNVPSSSCCRPTTRQRSRLGPARRRTLPGASMKRMRERRDGSASTRSHGVDGMVPALAVDGSGVALRRAAGSYDRALARVRPGTGDRRMLFFFYQEERARGAAESARRPGDRGPAPVGRVRFREPDRPTAQDREWTKRRRIGTPWHVVPRVPAGGVECHIPVAVPHAVHQRGRAVF